MVNHVTNDKGESVIAVGAPGSIERVKIEFPKLIDEISGEAESDAREAIKRAGISSKLETACLLAAREPFTDAWGDECAEPETCGNCGGVGTDWGETCLTCGGRGRVCS